MPDTSLPNTVDALVPTAAPTDRRRFLRDGALAALVAGALAACSKSNAAPAPSTPTTPAKAAAAAPVALSPRAKSDEMDRMHEAGIKAFPAKTEGKGNQLLDPRIDNGVKVYELTATELQWEVSPGQVVEAWAYNGQVPGPQIRVKQGDRVRVNLTNKLPESTAIHFHGVSLVNGMDGVPFITSRR